MYSSLTFPFALKSHHIHYHIEWLDSSFCLYTFGYLENSANLYLKTKDLKSLSSSSCKSIHFTCTKTFIFSTSSGSPKWQIVNGYYFLPSFEFFFPSLSVVFILKKKKSPDKPSSLSLTHMLLIAGNRIMTLHIWTLPLLLRHSFCVVCNATMLIPR